MPIGPSTKLTEDAQYAKDSDRPSRNPIPLALVEPAQSGILKPVVADDDKDASISNTKLQNTVQVVSISMNCIHNVSSVCLKIHSMVNCDANSKSEVVLAKLLGQPEPIRRQIWEGIQRAKTKLGTGDLPKLDPIKDLNVKDPRVKKLTEVKTN